MSRTCEIAGASIDGFKDILASRDKARVVKAHPERKSKNKLNL